VDDGIMKSAPEPILRWLFEAFRLEVRYDKVAGWADCSVTIQEETVDHLSAKQLPVVADEVAGERSLLVGAPNGTLFKLGTPALRAPRRADDLAHT